MKPNKLNVQGMSDLARTLCLLSLVILPSTQEAARRHVGLYSGLCRTGVASPAAPDAPIDRYRRSKADQSELLD